MPRPCPHIPGFACPMMPGLECPELPGAWPAGSADAKLAYCRTEAVRAGFLVVVAGRYERKTGFEGGQGPEFRRSDGK